MQVRETARLLELNPAARDAKVAGELLLVIHGSGGWYPAAPDKSSEIMHQPDRMMPTRRR
jgi:hypothetical protein